MQRAYGAEVVYERHRHRYEVNNRYRARLEASGLVCSGASPDDRLVEFIELPESEHPFFVATQAHPEFKSRPDRPHPLFAAFVAAAHRRAEGRRAAAAARGRARDRGDVGRPRVNPPPDPGGADPGVPGLGSGGFEVVAEETVETVGFLRIDRLTVRGPGGEIHERNAIRHPGAVVVVPVERGGTHAILVRQFRAAIGGLLLEVPAGKRDVDGEPPEETATPRARRGDRVPAGPPGEARGVLQLARVLRRVHPPLRRARRRAHRWRRDPSARRRRR